MRTATSICSLGSIPAHELGKVAIKAAVERAGLQSGDISEVVLGQVLTAGQGQNPARQAAIAAGIPVDSPAWLVNQVCGSALRAVALETDTPLVHGYPPFAGQPDLRRVERYRAASAR